MEDWAFDNHHADICHHDAGASTEDAAEGLLGHDNDHRVAGEGSSGRDACRRAARDNLVIWEEPFRPEEEML